MKRYARQWHQRLTMVCFACLLGTALFSGPARAADKHFIGPSGLWNTPAIWSPAGIPAPGDNVYLDKDDASSYYVSYNTNINLNYLNIYNLGSGSMTFHQGNLGVAYNLTTVKESIGIGGIGTHYQYRGSNTVTNLILGGGAAGTYNLQGETATVNAATLSINNHGRFNLTSGTLKADVLNLNSGGIFNQTGGSLRVDSFMHSGGTVKGTLDVSGNYSYGSGVFEGRLVANGPVQFSANFTAGNGMDNRWENSFPYDRTFTFNGAGLWNTNQLNFNNNTILGSGSIQNNGVFTGAASFDGTGALENNGIYSFPLLKINTKTVNNNYGQMIFESQIDQFNNKVFPRLVIGDGSWLVNYGKIGMDSGGPSLIYGGKLENQKGGTIAASGIINLSTFGNLGLVSVTGGDCSIINPMNNDGVIYLEKGNLAGGEIINMNGHILASTGHVGNEIYNVGKIEAKGGSLFMTGPITQYGTMMVTGPESQIIITMDNLKDNYGSIILAGGTFDTKFGFTNWGSISGYGNFRSGQLLNKSAITLSGGNTIVNAVITNEKGGTIALYNTTMFIQKVTNFGTIKTYGGVANTNKLVFAGGYEEWGTYNSDPATQHFSQNVVIGAPGAWTGGVGDRFILQEDFKNQSKANLAWNTLQAELAFQAGGDNTHLMYLPGADRGAARTGFQNNFSWGILDLSGQTLNLLDGNTASGGAFYVSEILGAELTGQNIANIFGHGLNIYYDPLLAGNAYLHGRSYVLQDGGLLAPISATPVPGSLWLALSGLAALAVIGRRGRADRKS